jgi:hypothetical protein
MRHWKEFLVLAGVACLISAATAQVATTSAIVGTVTDQSGAVLDGVSVTITDLSTGYQRAVQTSVDGNYTAENVRPGTYDISVRKEGFKEKKITGIVLQVAQRARIDIPMEVGTVAQQVEVRGATPTVETETSSVGKVITTQDVVNLPLNGRQFLQLASLVPGVHKTYNPTYLEDTGGSVSANGMSNESNKAMVDGIMNQEIGAGRMTFSPSVDLIQEFKIQTNTYDAEYGRTGGSQVELVTKRGSNSYHGSLYEFLRNNALDASPYFQPGALPAFRRNQFGGTLGGHIPHDKKDYFFVAYEGLRLSQGLTKVISVPQASILPAGRNGPANFSSTGTIIYDPLTLNTTTGRRQPFPGDVIPAGRLNAVSLFYLNSFMPAANLPGAANNFVANPFLHESSNQISFRYDRDFSEKDSVTFRYTRNKLFELQPLGNQGANLPVPGLGEDEYFWGLNHLIRWTHLFSGSTMNTLNIGFSQYHQKRFNEDSYKGIIAASGIQGIMGGSNAGIPQFNITGYASITDNRVSPVEQPFGNYILSDTFAKVWGRHSLRLGGGLLYNRAQTFFHANDRGRINFAPTYTTASVGAAGNQYNAFAEFLLGTPASSSISLEPLETDWRSSTEFGFVQDDWHVTQTLSLNLGLRYDVYTRPYEEHNKMSAFDVASLREIYPGSIPNLAGVPANSAVASSLGYPRSLQFPTTYNNWAPRIGFAWKVLGSQSTVLRGGAGLFYNWVVIDSATNLSLGPPWVPTPSITCNSDVPCLDGSNPFTSPLVANPNNAAWVANKTNRTPYTQQYSLGIQHAFTQDLSLEVNYVGNVGRKNLIVENINQPAPGPGSVVSRQPYPGRGASLNDIFTIGSSNYNSLQGALRKTYSQGLMLLASYTYGHALGNSISGPQFEENGTNAAGGLRYYKNLNAEYGNSVYDLRHVLSVSSIYELPFGKGRRMANNLNSVADGIVGGWSLEGIFSYNSGGFVTPSDIVNVSNSGSSRPDEIGDPNGFSHPSRSAEVHQWFNTAAFQRAPLYTFGTSGYGIIHAPGYSDFDLSFQKRFLLGEHVGLQLRGEFFNAFNHTNLGAPTTTFGTATFGTISSIVGNARDVQVGARLDF